MDFILNFHITNKKNYFVMSKSRKTKKKPTQFFVGNYFKFKSSSQVTKPLQPTTKPDRAHHRLSQIYYTKAT